MVAMFVREEDAIELLGSDTAEREAQDELTRAQSSIDQNACNDRWRRARCSRRCRCRAWSN